jgi:hypothetical protein
MTPRCALVVPSGFGSVCLYIKLHLSRRQLAKTFGVADAKAETSDIKSADGQPARLCAGIRRGEHRRVRGL